MSFIQIRKGNFDFFTDAFLMNPWTELFEAWLVGGTRGLLNCKWNTCVVMVTKPEFARIKLLLNNSANSTGTHI